MKRGLYLALLLGGCAATAEPQQRASTLRVLDARGCVTLGWPVDAPLSSGFGRRDARPHQGIDLSVPEGTPVRAACDGVVAYASDQLRGYGRMVVLEHLNGLSTVYAHNRSLLVQPGSLIHAGQVIAESGQTGRASGPHVHFEVRDRGNPIDPLSRLERRSRMLPARARLQRPE